HGHALCPSTKVTVRSTQDAKRKLGRAPALDELDRLVEIDVHAGRQRDCVVAREAHAHELGGAPALHAVEFGLDDFVCRSHPQCPSFTFGNLRRLDLPLRGDLRATFGYWTAAAPRRCCTEAKKSGCGSTRYSGPSSRSFGPSEVTRSTYTGASPGKSRTTPASSRITPAGALRASTLSRTSRRSGTASNAETSSATSFVSPCCLWSMRPLT